MGLRKINAGIMLGIWILIVTAQNLMAASACDHVDLAWISSQVALDPDAKIVFKQDRGEICEVVLAIDGNLAPVYAGQSFIVAGRMFKERKNITRETMTGLSKVAEQERVYAREKEAMAVKARKAFFKANADKLAPLVAASFGPGDPKGEIFLITDPNCTHCKALLPGLEEAAFEAKMAIKLIIYPVLGTKSRNMAAHALCNKLSYLEYKEMTGTQAPAKCQRADDLIEETMAFFNSPGIRFVPIVVAGDGSWVVEGNKICDVRLRLGLKNDGYEIVSGKGCTPDSSQ